jgi:hypothetical protein
MCGSNLKNRCPMGIFEPHGHLFIEARKQVPVGIHGHRDRGVAESALDQLRMRVLGDHEARR